MAREEYQRSLADLRERVLRMGDLVLERFEQAVRALRERDRDLAREVIGGDDEVNRLYLDLEKECIDLVALQQPVASDLRFIAASFKIITDLERIADLATNLARQIPERDERLFPEVSVADLTAIAAGMVREALAAYGARDPAACHAVAERDDELDGLCERVGELVIRALVEMDADADLETLLSDVTRLLLTVRDLERVGDHAVNIAARTLYMVESSDLLLY